MAIINSPTNFRVLNWTKLKNKVYRDKQKLFLVEGFHPVQEAYKAGALKEIICTEPIKISTCYSTRSLTLLWKN